MTWFFHTLIRCTYIAYTTRRPKCVKKIVSTISPKCIIINYFKINVNFFLILYTFFIEGMYY